MSFHRKILLLLLLSCLNKALAKRCPRQIPRSGKAANQINCFTVLFDDGERPYILVSGIAKDHIQGKLWYPDKQRYAGVIRIRKSYAATLSLKVIHYIGPSEIEYTGVVQFWLGEATRFPHLVLAMRRAWDYLLRSLFNKRSQLEVDRDKLLEYVVGEYAVSGAVFDAGSVLTSMYNYRWYSHPAANSARKRTEYLLGSLVVSGDLEQTSYYHYRVLPSAFRSLNEIQQARQRHRQSMRIQRSIILLTLGSLVAALVQAGVIQSPPIVKADCILERGVARDCTLRYGLFPDRLLSRMTRRYRSE